MQVRHTDTGLNQNISKEDFEILKETGHAKNFEVISAEDFTPSEAQVEPTPAEKDNSTPAAKTGPKQGDK